MDGETYVVIVVDKDTIQLAATAGGAAIDIDLTTTTGDMHSLDPVEEIVLAIHLDTTDNSLWVAQYLAPEHLNASTDAAVDAAKHFLRRMAQPLDPNADLGTTLFGERELRKFQDKQKLKRAEAKEQ